VNPDDEAQVYSLMNLKIQEVRAIVIMSEDYWVSLRLLRRELTAVRARKIDTTAQKWPIRATMEMTPS
jgi:hypothetical protein